jgi:hypothetical protein
MPPPPPPPPLCQILFVFELPEFLQQVSTGSQNIKGFVIIFLFSYLFYSQIWLNLWLDDCWFG